MSTSKFKIHQAQLLGEIDRLRLLPLAQYGTSDINKLVKNDLNLNDKKSAGLFKIDATEVNSPSLEKEKAVEN